MGERLPKSRCLLTKSWSCQTFTLTARQSSSPMSQTVWIVKASRLKLTRMAARSSFPWPITLQSRRELLNHLWATVHSQAELVC